jgi:hypothetical protein
MRVTLIIIAVHAVLIGFGCLIAGWLTLIGADEVELTDLKQGVDLARHKSWVEAVRFAWRWRFQYPQLCETFSALGRPTTGALFVWNRTPFSRYCRNTWLFLGRSHIALRP